MKKIIVFLLILALLLTASCSDNDIIEKPIDSSDERKIEPIYFFDNIIENAAKEVGSNHFEIIVDSKIKQKIDYPVVKGKSAFNKKIKEYIFNKKKSLIESSSDSFNEVAIDYEIFKAFGDYYSIKIYSRINGFNNIDYLVFSNKDNKFIAFSDIYTNKAKKYLKNINENIDFKNFLYLDYEVHFLNDKLENIIISKDIIKDYKVVSYSEKLKKQRNKNKIKINPKKPMVALTFDDGPHSEHTEKILDCLKENNSNATFFVLGRNVKLHKGIIKKAYLNGNDIGNHSFTHANLVNCSDEAIEKEINETDNLIYKEIGKKPYYFRPPYGSFNSRVTKIADKAIILWNVDTLDWRYRDSDRTYNYVLDNLKDGNIILLHDIHKTTLEATLKLIPEIRKKGYQIVSLSQMSKYKKVKIKRNKVYTRIGK